MLDRDANGRALADTILVDGGSEAATFLDLRRRTAIGAAESGEAGDVEYAAEQLLRSVTAENMNIESEFEPYDARRSPRSAAEHLPYFIIRHEDSGRANACNFREALRGYFWDGRVRPYGRSGLYSRLVAAPRAGIAVSSSGDDPSRQRQASYVAMTRGLPRLVPRRRRLLRSCRKTRRSFLPPAVRCGAINDRPLPIVGQPDGRPECTRLSCRSKI